MTEPTVVLVLGMHRSGTSLVSQLVQRLGVFGGEEQEQLARDEWNAGGYFEVRGVLDLNQKLLLDHGYDLSLPPIEFDHPLSSGGSPERQQEARELVREYQSRGNGTWVWKDPRFCLTLPWWRPLLPKVQVILCLRHPTSIAESLVRRDAFPIERSIKLWEIYLRHAVWNCQDLNVLTLEYEAVIADPAAATQRLHAHLSRAGLDLLPEAEVQGLGSLMRKELVHFSSRDDKLLDPRQARLYQTARTGAVDLQELRRTQEECRSHRSDLLEITAQSLRAELGRKQAELDRKQAELDHFTTTAGEERAFRLQEFQSLRKFCDQQMAVKQALAAKTAELEEALEGCMQQAKQAEAEAKVHAETIERLQEKLNQLARQNPLQRLLGKQLRDDR